MAYYIGIICLSSIPGSDLPNLFSGFPYLDKVIHFSVYAGLGLLLRLAGLPIALVLGIVGGLGGLDELYQQFTPGRFCDIFDWCADFSGGFFGAFLGAQIQKRFPRVVS